MRHPREQDKHERVKRPPVSCILWLTQQYPYLPYTIRTLRFLLAAILYFFLPFNSHCPLSSNICATFSRNSLSLKLFHVQAKWYLNFTHANYFCLPMTFIARLTSVIRVCRTIIHFHWIFSPFTVTFFFLLFSRVKYEWSISSKNVPFLLATFDSHLCCDRKDRRKGNVTTRSLVSFRLTFMILDIRHLSYGLRYTQVRKIVWNSCRLFFVTFS